MNGSIVTELGRARSGSRCHQSGRQEDSIDDRFVYVLLYKPKNRDVHTDDPQNRPTVMEYVAKVKERIYPVGRLDFASEGLIILTNDGDFTKFMTKAGIVPKVYHVKLAGNPKRRCCPGCVVESFWITSGLPRARFA